MCLHPGYILLSTETVDHGERGELENVNDIRISVCS